MDVRVNVRSTASSRLAPPAAAAELLGTIGASIGPQEAMTVPPSGLQ